MTSRQPSLPFALPKRAAPARTPEIEPFTFDASGPECEPRTLADVPEWLRLCWEEDAG